MFGKLFGFGINRVSDVEKQNKKIVSFVSPENEDGAIDILGGGAYGVYVDMDGPAKTESDLVTRYRDMMLHPEVESAVDDVITEMVVDDDFKDSVEVDVSGLVNYSDEFKKTLATEFTEILTLLDWRYQSYEITRRWYVDGRIYYHVIIDENNPSDGIQELRYVDPRKIKKIRENEIQRDSSNQLQVYVPTKEYYIYNEKGFGAGPSGAYAGNQSTGLKIAPDSVVYCTSGIIDTKSSLVLSHLHKAIKPLNQLRTLEDAAVIYRLSRAPERRVFYIDVGNLPKLKAEQYLRDMMVRYKNKTVYDACLSMDTRIPLLDGRVLTLTEMQKEFEAGKEMWIYACNPKTGEFAPGLVSSAGVTGYDQEVMKVTLDNGEEITCTPDHKFPVWNKGKVEAKDLVVGDTMIPFNTKSNQFFDNVTKTWKSTQQTVSEWKLNKNVEQDFEYNELEKDCKHFDEGVNTYTIVKIEKLDERITVGTLGIDKEEKYHDFHTFALESGIYTCNSTGEVRDDRKIMTMLEDFWLPRREGGRGTEIRTLEGGSNLSEMGDVEYFQKRLYKSLNVPISRLEDNVGFSLGRSSEISRDELKFGRFIQRLRRRFNKLFIELLEKQLLLRGIVNSVEWEDIYSKIRFIYAHDSYFTELKDSEILRDRLDVLSRIDQYVGMYYSSDWVRKHVLYQTEIDIDLMSTQIVDDIQKQEEKSRRDARIAGIQALEQQMGQEGNPPDPLDPQEFESESESTGDPIYVELDQNIAAEQQKALKKQQKQQAKSNTKKSDK